ncbi:hypothetical protein [Thauera sinica]|uniref:Uncharacterized protein n=1 Tax=Thauera sinica TaxID=2665146 RepID=A0ABW1ATI9_9RHOO|nr:hypothetical protein [Thauera sp. K11]
MPSSTTPNGAWPDPGGLVLRLAVALGLVIAIALVGGRALVEAVLSITTPTLLGWIDDRFGILFLGLDHTGQDTVIRLRTNLVRMLVVGTHVVQPHPKGWLEVTTTVGAMLQPVTIGLGLAGAWPGKAGIRLLRLLLVAVLGVAFMLMDIPLTLHAYTWDMFLDHYDPDHVSPVMLTHNFLHGGGRLAVGVLMAALVIRGVPRNRRAKSAVAADPGHGL